MESGYVCTSLSVRGWQMFKRKKSKGERLNGCQHACVDVLRGILFGLRVFDSALVVVGVFRRKSSRLRGDFWFASTNPGGLRVGRSYSCVDSPFFEFWLG